MHVLALTGLHFHILTSYLFIFYFISYKILFIDSTSYENNFKKGGLEIISDMLCKENDSKVIV